MEVSASMALPAQLSQAVNGTAGADETGNPQSGSPLSARFSRLLEQRAGMGEDARVSSEPSANAMFLKVIASSMQPQATEMESGQGVEAGPETTALPAQDEETDDLSPGEGVQERPAYPVLTDTTWTQPVVCGNPAGPLPEVLTMQSSRKDETAISAMGGNAQAGFVAGGQSAELSAQNRQLLYIPPVNAHVEKQEATTPAQPATIPLQDGAATAITETGPSGMQSDANPDVGAEPRVKGMKQAANVTVPHAEVVSPKLNGIPLQLAKGQNTGISAPGSQESGNPQQEQATVAEIPVTVQIRMGGKEVANAYMASAGEAASNFSGIVSSITSGIRTAKQGLKDEGQSIKSNLYVADPALKPELNIMDPSGKPGLNSADPVQAQKQVEIAFAGETKSLVKEAGGEVPGTVSEDKSAGTDNPGLVVLRPGETRINADSRLSTPVTDGKQAFSEQIQHQVREKLESGDYGLNKGNITLKLHPEELGEIKINLRMEDQRLKVEIVTENRSVKEALMQNIDTLKETLSRQNITMDRFNVSADIRQGFQQGSRDGSRMMQENRGANTPFDSAVAVDENTLSKVNYGWESDNSLVSLIL